MPSHTKCRAQHIKQSGYGLSVTHIYKNKTKRKKNQNKTRKNLKCSERNFLKNVEYLKAPRRDAGWRQISNFDIYTGPHDTSPRNLLPIVRMCVYTLKRNIPIFTKAKKKETI
jgi:hypothetical protein